MFRFFADMLQHRRERRAAAAEREKARQELIAQLVRSENMGPQCDAVPGTSGRFGFDRSNPIPTLLQSGELHYLRKLRCPCGEPFFFHRLGSYGEGPDGHIIDGYELVCQRREHHYTLYFDMYHKGNTWVPPEGLSIGSIRGEGVPYLVFNFPDGLRDAVKARPR